MSGFVGHLSRKQEDALRRFKEAIRDVWRSEFDQDHYLLRWLRARGFDVKKAEKMLRTHLEWRKEVGADTILDDYIPNSVIKRYFPGGFCGRNKNGQPLWIDPTGHCDIRGLVKSVTRQDMMRSRIYLMEYIYRILLPKCSEKAGHLVEQTVVIFDLQHFGLRHMWRPGLDMLLDVAKMCEANYPETMGSCYVVNAPTFFPAIYRIVKPFLHESTQKKIQVLSSNYTEALRRYFDPVSLPARFGGEMRSPDDSPDCSHLVCYGGEIPPELYLTCDRANMVEKMVHRGGTLPVEQLVTNAGMRLGWEFCTEDHDLGFGVLCRLGGPEEEWKTVIETHRVSCHITPERGWISCEAPGVYVVRFDNSFSWTRTKRVWYRVFVEEGPKEDSEPIDNDVGYRRTMNEEDTYYTAVSE